MDHGAQSVMTLQLRWMPQLCADNWAMMSDVSSSLKE